MISDKAKELLKELRKINWIAFEKEKFVRKKLASYLEITLTDTTITNDVFRSLNSISDIRGEMFFVFIRNKRFIVRFLLGQIE